MNIIQVHTEIIDADKVSAVSQIYDIPNKIWDRETNRDFAGIWQDKLAFDIICDGCRIVIQDTYSSTNKGAILHTKLSNLREEVIKIAFKNFIIKTMPL